MISSRILNNTCTIYKSSNTVGTYGDVTEVLTHRVGPISCYITSLGGSKTVYAGKLQVVATHRLFMAPTPLIKSSDKVYCDEWEQWFNVLYVDRCSNFNQHYELLLEEVDEQDIQTLDSSSSSVDSSSSSSDSSSSSSDGGF